MKMQMVIWMMARAWGAFVGRLSEHVLLGDLKPGRGTASQLDKTWKLL